MSPDEANRLLPMVQAFVNGASIDFSAEVTQRQFESFSDSTKVKKKDVLVIPIDGVIMKHDYCGSIGTVTLEKIFFNALSDPSIGAIVLDIDSGGGQAAHLNLLFDAAYAFAQEKVLLTHFSGYCCSAAYYYAGASQKIYAASDLEKVGSIGTMSTIQRPNENNRGPLSIEFHYATASTNKNSSYRELMNGNPEPLIKKELDPLNNTFIANMKKARPQMHESVYTGIDVYADEAIKLGLIDGIKRLDDVINEAFSLIQ